MTTVGTQPTVGLPSTETPRSVLRIADLTVEEVIDLVEPATPERRLNGTFVVDVPAHLSHIRTAVEEAITHSGGEVLLTDWPSMWTDRTHPLGDRLQPPLRAAVISTPDHHRLTSYTRHSRVPIVNAGTDDHQPLKVLADLLTVRELLGRLRGVSVAYAGPANGYRASLVEAAVRTGLDLELVVDHVDPLLAEQLAESRHYAECLGGSLTIVDPCRRKVQVEVLLGEQPAFGLVATSIHLPLLMTGAAADEGTSVVEGPRELLFHRQESLQRITRRMLARIAQPRGGPS